MSQLPSQLPYVSRPEAEAFLAALADSLPAPATHPVVFHVWGIGGVGKSTLTRKVRELHQAQSRLADVSFGLTEAIEEPIPLMAKLYEQLIVKETWSRDPFWEKYDLYSETVHQLQTQAATGRGEATPDQVSQVKQLLQLGVDVAGELFLSTAARKTASTLVDKGTDAAVAGLSLKDSLQSLLQQHKATKRDLELQKFMLDPLPQLTRAFVQGLQHQSRQQPILLVLDTYEKVPAVIDTWLWRTLLGNTDLASCPTRLIIAGRHCIRRTEGWRKLHQDRNAIFDRTIQRFDLAQTTDYLRQIGLTASAQVEQIHQVTKGLPYYLNWIREQHAQGNPPDFDQGNQEIVRLLLQGLNDTQKLLVQLAACCRRFDTRVIRYLTEQHQLDFATAADEKQNCFGWLTQLSFVEPAGKDWRLDDVARDIFRQSLDREALEAIHTRLAEYFLQRSDQEVAATAPYSTKYNNPDWLAPRTEYLYHLLFTRQNNLQTVFLTHLLEARYFGKDSLVRDPFRAVTAEFELADHPLLRHSTCQFLQHIRPAIEYGWAVLEEYPLDYPYNQVNLGLNRADTDRAVTTCLQNPNQFQGLAHFAALLYKAKRCPPNQQLTWLQQAQAQVEQLAQIETPDFIAELWLYELGNSLDDLGRKEEAIACYDDALKIKPDFHEALNNKGNALAGLGRHQEAIECCDRVLAIKPDHFSAWGIRGIALCNLGRFEEAQASYDEVLELQPKNNYTIYKKACCYALQGDVANALAYLQRAMALYPECQAMAQTDSDFDSLRQHPDFQALVNADNSSPQG